LGLVAVVRVDKPLAYNVAWMTLIYVLAALVLHYLGTRNRFLERSGWLCGWQREVAWGNGVAAFLGHSTHLDRVDLQLLRAA